MLLKISYALGLGLHSWVCKMTTIRLTIRSLILGHTPTAWINSMPALIYSHRHIPLSFRDMDEFPCVLMEEMWCFQAELRKLDGFCWAEKKVVKRNKKPPPLVNRFCCSNEWLLWADVFVCFCCIHIYPINELSAMRDRSVVSNESHDLRKIPFHYSCSLCHGHCRYHLIPAIHSRKDPFNPTMTMRFRSDCKKNPGTYNDSSMLDVWIKILMRKGPEGCWSCTSWCIHVMINSKARLLSQKSCRCLSVLRNLHSLQLQVIKNNASWIR